MIMFSFIAEHVPDDPYALNAYGLLLEREKLYKPAVEVFTSALKLVRNDEERDSLRVNLSRVLLQLNVPDKAVEICQGVRNANFKSHCQLAVSLFKGDLSELFTLAQFTIRYLINEPISSFHLAARYEESYGAYEAALHWLAGDGSEKAHVLCAMAAMAYMFQGADDAKTLLFQCIQIQPPTVPGFLAAAALGLLNQDFNLTALVLKELKPFKDHPEHRSHITLLSAYARIVENDQKSAVRILSKAAHRHPGRRFYTELSYAITFFLSFQSYLFYSNALLQLTLSPGLLWSDSCTNQNQKLPVIVPRKRCFLVEKIVLILLLKLPVHQR